MTENRTGVSLDRFHTGRVTALQPETGYRAAVDPVLLAAALERPGRGHRLLDVGCGAGVASLCAASLIRALPGPPGDITLAGIDIDRSMLDLAAESIRRNGFDQGPVRVEAGLADVGNEETWPEAGSWDQVFSNPPYLEAGAAGGRARPAADTANMETAVGLRDWISFMTAMAKPKGRLVLVHRADRVSEITAAFRQGGVRAIEIFPFWPKQGAEAKRVIVRGRKGVRTADRLLPGMVLHRADGRFTDDAEAVLNGDAWLLFADG
ncbi:MAG: methyltransferase domain-containing protein [Alphaproteobacteria bacterium]